MRNINVGGVLPFYTANSLKSEDFFTAPTKHFVGGDLRLIPFQLALSASVATWEADLFNEAGTLVTALTLTIVQTADATTDIITFPASSNLSVVGFSVCNRYQVRIKENGSLTYNYFSDWIYVKSTWTHQISFTNDADLGGVMYQNSYTQRVLFDGYEDTPETDINLTAEVGLDGLEKVTSSRQTEKRVLVGSGFLDSQLSALQRISMHKTITVQENVTAQLYNIKRLDFEHEPQPDAANLGTFKFIVDTATVDGCGVNTYIL